MTRRDFAVGLAVNLLIVVGASIAAYAGWLRHRELWFLSRYDYCFHALLIGPLALFLDGVLSHRALAPRLGWFPPLAGVIVLSVAGVEELAQSLSPRRSTQLHDFVGDIVGVASFLAISRLIRRRSRQVA